MENQLMQTGALTTSQTEKLSSYLLAASPGAEVAKRILAERKLLVETYGITDTVHTTGIPVACFMAREDMEGTIIRWMHRIISAQKTFMVKLDQFNGSSSRGIYLRVEEQQPFQRMAKELLVVNQYIKSYHCPDMKLVSNPCLPMAKGLKEPVFQQIVNDYATRSFHACFEITELVLMRKQHGYDACKQVNVFRLQP